MKKQKVVYHYVRYRGHPLQAKREISYEIKLSSQLFLDKLCFEWNKKRLEGAINRSIDEKNEAGFMRLCKVYQRFL